jgi:psiF repeat
MTRSIWLVAVGAVLALGAGQFAGAEETAQQTKMTTCNADAKAKSLTGDDRKAFMKECLSNHPAATADKTGSQQEKMKTCNADAKAKALTGDARKAFMKDCLSSHPAAAAPAAGAAPAAATTH